MSQQPLSNELVLTPLVIGLLISFAVMRFVSITIIKGFTYLGDAERPQGSKPGIQWRYVLCSSEAAFFYFALLYMAFRLGIMAHESGLLTLTFSMGVLVGVGALGFGQVFTRAFFGAVDEVNRLSVAWLEAQWKRWRKPQSVQAA